MQLLRAPPEEGEIYLGGLTDQHTHMYGTVEQSSLCVPGELHVVIAGVGGYGVSLVPTHIHCLYSTAVC